MAPRPRADSDPQVTARPTDRRHIWRRRWLRSRAHMRIWRRRMHSHPVLHWTWRSLIVIVGGIILLAGIIMCVTPGPGALGILLGLAILATEFSWAHNLLHRARVWERKAREKAIATQRRRRERRAAFRTDPPQRGR